MKGALYTSLFTDLWQTHLWKKREAFVKAQIKKENMKLRRRVKQSQKQAA